MDKRNGKIATILKMDGSETVIVGFNNITA
jgi:hypothetical protein